MHTLNNFTEDLCGISTNVFPSSQTINERRRRFFLLLLIFGRSPLCAVPGCGSFFLGSSFSSSTSVGSFTPPIWCMGKERKEEERGKPRPTAHLALPYLATTATATADTAGAWEKRGEQKESKEEGGHGEQHLAGTREKGRKRRKAPFSPSLHPPFFSCVRSLSVFIRRGRQKHQQRKREEKKRKEEEEEERNGPASLTSIIFSSEEKGEGERSKREKERERALMRSSQVEAFFIAGGERAPPPPLPLSVKDNLRLFRSLFSFPRSKERKERKREKQKWRYFTYYKKKPKRSQKVLAQ